jgi:2'-5' RNA ligase
LPLARGETGKKGFRLEERGFKAHLTLGREITGYEKIRTVSVPSLEIAAEEIALMKSERLGGRRPIPDPCQKAPA